MKTRKTASDIWELAWFYQPGLGVARAWHWHIQLGLVEYNRFHRAPVTVVDPSQNKTMPHKNMNILQSAKMTTHPPILAMSDPSSLPIITPALIIHPTL